MLSTSNVVWRLN